MWETRGYLYGMFWTFSEVSKIKVQPFRRKKFVFFDWFSAGKLSKYQAAAGSEKAHEAMGKVGTAPTLQPASYKALHNNLPRYTC